MPGFGWTMANLPHKMPSRAFWKAEITKLKTPWPDSGIASWEKWEILPKFYNLLKGKNYKTIWEATPCSALLIFGGSLHSPFGETE